MGFTWYAFLCGGAAALLVGFSKTGMPGAAIPAIALMAEAFRQDTKLSVGAIVPVLILGDLFAITYYRRHVDWPRLLELAPYVVAGMVPGYLVLWQIDTEELRILIGVIILVLLALHIVRDRFGWARVMERRWFVAGTGMLAGFCTTVGNAAGPMMSIYLVSRRLDKHQFLGTTAWFFFFVNLSKVPLFTALDMITWEVVQFDLLLLPIAAAGAVVGAVVLKKMPQKLFNVLVLVLAGIAAVRMLVV